MTKTDYENMSREAVYAALENCQCPTSLVVVQLVLLYGGALEEGQDPRELMSKPPFPIEEVALEVAYVAVKELSEE